MPHTVQSSAYAQHTHEKVCNDKRVKICIDTLHYKLGQKTEQIIKQWHKN